MIGSDKRLLEFDKQPFESTKWSWIEDVVDTRDPGFIHDIGRAALGTRWVFLCEGSGLRESGDFFTDEIAGHLVLICRNEAGVLNGFRNVCLHLGAPVERNRHGRTRSFICPYHAWVFALDGKLNGVAMPEGYEGTGFQKEDFRLPEIPVTNVGSLVFGSTADDPGDPAANFAEVQPYLAGLFPDGTSWDIIFNCNLRVDLGWAEWMKRSRAAYAEGKVAGSLLGLSAQAYGSQCELTETSSGHQVALFRGTDLAGLERRYGIKRTAAWGKGRARFLEEKAYAGCVLHVAPNLVIGAMGDSIATLRVDPLDEGISMIRIQGYGRQAEDPALRQARLQQLQLWWGPGSEQVHLLSQ